MSSKKPSMISTPTLTNSTSRPFFKKSAAAGSRTARSRTAFIFGQDVYVLLSPFFTTAFLGLITMLTIQTIHFLKTIKQPRYEDYNIRYRYGNRFAYLGNGEVKANVTKDVNGLSTYVRNTDEEWDVE